MKKIVITGGRYGYISPSGVYSVKTVDDPPFEVENEEAERLVKLGVAKIHGEGGKLIENKGTTPSEGSNPANSGENGGTPAYDMNTPVNELREIGKSVGISFKVGTKKEDMVAALDEYFSDDADDDGVDGDDINDIDDELKLSAADPVE